MKMLVVMIAIGLASFSTAGAHPEAHPQELVHSPGKPEHPLQVELRARGSLQAGRETDVELIVSSAYALESVEIRLRPEGGTMLSQDRFEHRDSERLATGEFSLPLRITPASDEAQTLAIHVQAVMPDGRMITREMSLAVDGKRKSATPARKKKDASPLRQRAPAQGDDIVLPAEQDLERSAKAEDEPEVKP